MIVVTWLTVKLRMWVAKLRTDQTVSSSVMKARVVTVFGVILTFSVVSHSFRGGNYCRIAIDWVTKVGVQARSSRFNVNQESSCPALELL